ncbi:hypothetical protein [Streptosporangium sp. NPDC049644]|uniref:hypothetical protein n=1 Tax=Streptosporangium sp. NPDC049644 TaxID=3155507 RepID=UPI003419E79E
MTSLPVRDADPGNVAPCLACTLHGGAALMTGTPVRDADPGDAGPHLPWTLRRKRRA